MGLRLVGHSLVIKHARVDVKPNNTHICIYTQIYIYFIFVEDSEANYTACLQRISGMIK